MNAKEHAAGARLSIENVKKLENAYLKRPESPTKAVAARRSAFINNAVPDSAEFERRNAKVRAKRKHLANDIDETVGASCIGQAHAQHMNAALRALEGRWYHMNNTSLVETIVDGIVIGPDGTRLPLQMQGHDRFFIVCEDVKYHAQRVDAKLVW